jgi:peptidoglycan/xylan/chitin deacetylase (PgdA/CDA1 family)
MTWDQVRALRRAGMGVGSHSHRHPVLPMAGDEAVRDELVRSKAALEAALGGEVRTLAYPVGRFDERAKAAAREAGYALAYSYCTGASRLEEFDPYEVRRVPVEHWMSPAEFRSTAAFPMLT